MGPGFCRVGTGSPFLKNILLGSDQKRQQLRETKRKKREEILLRYKVFRIQINKIDTKAYDTFHKLHGIGIFLLVRDL